MEPCLPAIHSCCRSTAWSHLTPSICGFNAKRGGNKSEYFGIYLAKLLVLSDTPGIWKKQQKQWNIRKKIHAMEGFQIYNLEPCHARVSKIFYLVRFRIFEPYQSSKNNIKQLKSIEKQWNMMKKRKNKEKIWHDRKKQWIILKNKTKTMNHDEKKEKTMNHDEK